MEFKDERSARLGHLAVTIFILFGKGYFEPEDGILFGHGYIVSAKMHGDRDK
jgi:hypothetical protein